MPNMCYNKKNNVGCNQHFFMVNFRHLVTKRNSIQFIKRTFVKEKCESHHILRTSFWNHHN
jgi:hypothetical protein